MNVIIKEFIERAVNYLVTKIVTHILDELDKKQIIKK